jgi:hypothetical protein
MFPNTIIVANFQVEEEVDDLVSIHFDLVVEVVFAGEVPNSRKLGNLRCALASLEFFILS